MEYPLTSLLNAYSEEFDAYSLEEILNREGYEMFNKIYQTLSDDERQNFLSVSKEWDLEGHEHKNGYLIVLQLWGLPVLDLMHK